MGKKDANNLTECKYCSHIVAVNAKKCPGCGAKLKRSYGCLTSILIVLLIPIILIGGYKFATRPRNYRMGEYATVGDYEICLDKVSYYTYEDNSSPYGMWPVQELNDSVIIYYSYTIRNIGKETQIIYEPVGTLNYGKGYEFGKDSNGTTLMKTSQSGRWNGGLEFIHLDPLSSPVRVEVQMEVPRAVMKNTNEKLSWNFNNNTFYINATFKIR